MKYIILSLFALLLMSSCGETTNTCSCKTEINGEVTNENTIDYDGNCSDNNEETNEGYIITCTEE